ncbi:biliverdin-producing heme oxygenase [Massilia sp. DWR3-1-1]|uniref:biliverdin-producing heme oxygenase n=1 Tax=Massilia sp. DWR3-1-1 TaxID=2804559 RepID=UPI003CE8380C
MNPADLIAALRHATSAQHAILDSGLPLAQPDAGLAAYVAHLRMLARWLGPINAWLGQFSDGPQGPGAPPPLDRLAGIIADLAAAGEPAPPPDLHAAWPAHASPAYRWGVAYVVEGSQLGGAVLYQRLAERLAPHPLAYLKPPADGPGPRWRAVMAALRAQVRTDAELADACDGACAAFARVLALGGTVPAVVEAQARLP